MYVRTKLTRLGSVLDSECHLISTWFSFSPSLRGQVNDNIHVDIFDHFSFTYFLTKKTLLARLKKIFLDILKTKSYLVASEVKASPTDFKYIMERKAN